MTREEIHSEHLPALAPDLLLVRRGQSPWQVQRLSARLQHWLQIPVDQLRGRALDGLFPQAVPSLAELASEVLERGLDLSDIKLRLAGDQAELLADVQFAGLTEDYQGQLVRINLRGETIASRQEIGFRTLIGSSPAMREVFRKIRLYAAADAAVIITGETGTGKELVAQALHAESARHAKPLAELNCAALSEQLLESELFGHERGAFTGALREHRGYFERADGGTLFLDEIGDLPLHIQSKLLRVLEDGRVQRVGAERSRQVDVRVVGATNVPLEQAVAEQRFRADLYHRLAVLRIHLPPLRERPEDIPLLAEQFLQQYNHKYQKGVQRLTSEALRLLQAYRWPGNVRELRNVLERVVVEAETEAIGARAFTEWIRERQQFVRPAVVAGNPQHLPIAVAGTAADPELRRQPLDLPRTASPLGRRAALSEARIRAAYAETGGNLSAAARRLGVHRATLYRHLQRLNLSRDSLS